MEIPKKRIGGLTLFGAVGNCLRRPVFLEAESTNKEDCLRFLQLVKENLTCQGRPFLVYDQHRSHNARIVKPFIEEHFH